MKSNALMICLCIFFYAQLRAQTYEDFSFAPLTSSYSNNSYEGNNGIMWSYSQAKGGQKTSLNLQDAICLNKASSAYLQSDSITGGLSFLQIEYEQEYSSNIDASILINNIEIAHLYSENEADVTKTHTLNSLNITDKFVIKIIQNSSSAGQISISKISWVKNSSIEPIEIDSLPQVQPTEKTVRKLKYGDIVISEIMIDPTPTVGLDDYEYIELYNNTKDTLKIDSLELIVGNTKKEIPEFNICPHAYKILCATKDTIYCKNAIGIKSFPSLTNTQNTITLLTKDEIISCVSYENTWYKNAFKENGGWSLEKIELKNVSETAKNWTASVDYSGGTPGYENSVNSNKNSAIKTEIEELYLKNDSCLFVKFNQNIHIDSITFKRLNFDTIITESYSLRNYIIQLNNNCKNGVEYSFTFNQKEYSFAIIDSLLNLQDIYISELLTNPLPEQSDYIVLINNSNKILDISDVYLAKRGDSDFENITQIQAKKQLWLPQEKIVISEDVAFWENESYCASNAKFINCNLPSLADESGHILVCNKWGELIDSVYYSECMHNPLLESIEGVAYARIGQHNLWVSAENPEPACETHLEASCIITTENQKIKKGENQKFTVQIQSTELIKEVSVEVFSQQGALQYSKHFNCGEYSSKIDWGAYSNAGNVLPSSVYFMVIQVISETAIIASKDFTIIVTD